MERQYLIHYNTSGATSVPALDDLKYGEISVRYAAGNEALFIKNTDDELVTLELNKSIDLSGFYSKEEINEIVVATGTAINENGEKINTISSNTETLTNEVNVLKEDMDTIDTSVSTALTELHEQVEDILLNKADTVHTHEEFTILQGSIDVKQDVISDLDDIRSGSEKGATSVQPSDLSEYAKTSQIPSLDGYVTESVLNGKSYATQTDLSNLNSNVMNSLNNINSQLSTYALKSELPTDYAKTSDLDNYTTTEYTSSIVAELDNKQNKTITITKKGEDATILEFVKVLETGPQLDSNKYIIDSDSNSITEESKEIWYLTYENIFTYVTVLKTGTSGPEQWKIYQNEAILSFPELGQYKYEGDTTKNYYYCTENGKYYKWNINNRILEETTQPSTTVSKTITIQEAIQEIYIKLGLL